MSTMSDCPLKAAKRECVAAHTGVKTRVPLPPTKVLFCSAFPLARFSASGVDRRVAGEGVRTAERQQCHRRSWSASRCRRECQSRS